jgi:hypothetical protein
LALEHATIFDETEDIRRDRLAVINGAVESQDAQAERKRLEAHNRKQPANHKRGSLRIPLYIGTERARQTARPGKYAAD